MSKQAVQASLLEKKEQLETRISAIKADFKKGRSQDFAEQATESENDQVLDEIHQESKVELAQVNKALLHLEEGSYGYCESCHEAIHSERLSVLPYAVNCVNCAS